MSYSNTRLMSFCTLFTFYANSLSKTSLNPGYIVLLITDNATGSSDWWFTNIFYKVCNYFSPYLFGNVGTLSSCNLISFRFGMCLNIFPINLVFRSNSYYWNVTCALFIFSDIVICFLLKYKATSLNWRENSSSKAFCWFICVSKLSLFLLIWAESLS